MAQMNLSTEKKIMDMENRLVVAKREVEGVGGTGSLGLVDANYCTRSGYVMRSCCAAQGNYIQSLVMEHDGKYCEKKEVPVVAQWKQI